MTAKPMTPMQNTPDSFEPGVFRMGMADDGLLSHDLSIVVPSALRGLTTVFGMGTGVAPARWSAASTAGE